MLRGVFDSYYADIPSASIVFDTNRSWTGKIALLHKLYPRSKIICCVRDVGWIVDSFERLFNRNPVELSKVLNYDARASIYERADLLMNTQNGQIGQAWATMREAWFGENASKLIIVEYEKLCRDPKYVINKLYASLDEPPFAHNFSNLSYDEPQYDADLGLPGLHKIKPIVEFQQRQACLPPDLFAKYSQTNFWQHPALNGKGVVIL